MEVEDGVLEAVVAAETELERDEQDAPSLYATDVSVTEQELSAAHPEGSAEDALAHEDEPADEELTGRSGVPLDLVRIDAIAGVPLYYGEPQPKPHRPAIDRTFLPLLEATVRQVQARAPASFGKLRRLVDAGIYTPKSDKLHTVGRAIDWNRFVFDHVEIAPYAGDDAAKQRAKRVRYWALAAICRSNSCYVLHALWDNKHKDHIHQDNGYALPFNTKESTVKLCQAVLNEIFGQTPKLAADGFYRDTTKNALAAALRKLKIEGTVDDLPAWTQFLRRSGRLGFEISSRM